MDAAKKKPALSLVISSEGKGDKAGDDADDSGEYSAVIGELYDAMKADDREGFEEAFKAAVMSCK